MAHITGGGLVDNVERILPEGCRAVIDRGKWRPPAVFSWFESLGAVDAAEMWKTFNMGIGFVLIVSPRGTATVTTQLAATGVEHALIGRIGQGPSGVELAD
jgi:phosphoribosylformylglycinamidine cyclo-ligase